MHNKYIVYYTFIIINLAEIYSGNYQNENKNNWYRKLYS